MSTSPSDILTDELKQQLIDFRFPYITNSLPGIGGVLKQEFSDFIVEEIPVYQPCGEGEHLFLWIEKAGVSGPELIQHISQVLDYRADEIGSAGLKDKQAITRQFISLPVRFQEQIAKIETDQIKVLSATPHQNKLKTGHLVGNRFSILVREVNENALEKALQIKAELLKQGVPNYYGGQRFGSAGKTVFYGLKSLFQPAKRVRGKRARFELSAVQSWLFNLALAQRINDGLFNSVLPGDVMQVRKSGGPFVVEDVDAEQARLTAGETGITGPLFGPKMKMPVGGAWKREEQLLKRIGIDLNQFAQHRKLCSGTRRAYSLLLPEIEIEPETNGLRFKFELPSGAYATVVLREFMKTKHVEE